MVASLILFTGCMPSETPTAPITSNEILSESINYEHPIYVFGDSTYEKQLLEGRHPVKLGPITSDSIPDSFPKKFLEPDGSYAGGHIYRTIEEAERAILEAKQKGLIPEEGNWGVYQINGNWDEYVYELRPNEYYLRKASPVMKKVK